MNVYQWGAVISLVFLSSCSQVSGTRWQQKDSYLDSKVAPSLKVPKDLSYTPDHERFPLPANLPDASQLAVSLVPPGLEKGE